jgi:hypothetical protein
VIEITWSRRPYPLAPAAVLGLGETRNVLAAHLLDRISAGADLQVHASGEYLLAVGGEADLPWVDGAVWLGREAGLLLPTTAAVEPNIDLVSRAIRRRVGTDAGWIVLIPGQILVGNNPIGLPDLERLRAIAAGTE